MTLAKKTFYLSSALLVASAIGVAQTPMGSPQDRDNSTASQAAGAKLRGCLSGSDGNYTLTDHNGVIYHLVGGDAQLSRSVGHEVEITGTPDAQRSGASDDMASNTASSFQVTGAREVGAGCEHGSSAGTMGTNSQPMTERPPSTDQQPKGAPGEGAPPQPEPHMIAMLQQPGSTDMGPQSSSSSTTSSPSSTDSQNGSMANTPVTNQTPAEPASPTGANSQPGRGSANPSSVSTQPAQTDTAATPGSNPGPETNSGVNRTSGTITNPDMNANSGAATNAGASASPQSTQNDQNKPLYERTATDVPWASHSGATTTTTTTPQPEPHQ
jgi:hypothetical protein